MMKRAVVAVVVMIGIVCVGSASAGPLKVYILVGQSNMQGHAHVSTFDAMALDPEAAPLLAKMRQEDGTPVVCDDVWVSSIGCSPEEKIGRLTVGFGAERRGPNIGPEFTFGIFMAEHVKEPILIIKTAWGGKSLHTDFRPPSAGPYTFSDAQLEQMKKQGKNVEEVVAKRAEASGHYYRLMMEHVKKVLADPARVYPDYDAEAGYELAGFVWFQGWNDMVDRGVYPNRDKPGGYDAYSALLAQFIRDVRKDLDAPKLPFVIGVIGVGGPFEGRPENRYTPIHRSFREAMAAPASLPEFKGNVAAVETADCWDVELSELRARGGKVKAKQNELAKDESLSPDERKARLNEFRDQLYTDRERKLLKGASNADFHYMGSGKVLARIGKAFAEALIEMESDATG